MGPKNICEKKNIVENKNWDRKKLLDPEKIWIEEKWGQYQKNSKSSPNYIV